MNRLTRPSPRGLFHVRFSRPSRWSPMRATTRHALAYCSSLQFPPPAPPPAGAIPRQVWRLSRRVPRPPQGLAEPQGAHRAGSRPHGCRISALMSQPRSDSSRSTPSRARSCIATPRRRLHDPDGVTGTHPSGCSRVGERSGARCTPLTSVVRYLERGPRPSRAGVEGSDALDWPEIHARAVRREDEHDIKLAYSCWREWQHRGDDLYRRAASARVS